MLNNVNFVMVAQIYGVIFVFYDRFIELCNQRNEKPTALVEDLGYTRGLASHWKKKYDEGKDFIPDALTLIAISKHFGVSVEYLATGEKVGEEKELIRILNSVNITGREKILEYAKDIQGNPVYRQDTASSAVS